MEDITEFHWLYPIFGVKLSNGAIADGMRRVPEIQIGGRQIDIYGLI